MECLLRYGKPDDATTIAALATQVFLDTYATQGVRDDLAREAFSQYSPEAFRRRLGKEGRVFVLAERQGHLVGFVEFMSSANSDPVSGAVGGEVVRLYVQPRAQRQGIGTMLLRCAEGEVSSRRLHHAWLTAWEGNGQALSFYAKSGYVDVGPTRHTIDGRTYTNRVLVRRLRPESRRSFASR
jgi:ribosomal protein S18 acetylase RimI-like enzyme